MKLYLATQSTLDAGLTTTNTNLACVTTVLQHESGQLGFGLGRGDEIVRSIVGKCIALSVSNRPAWLRLAPDQLSSSLLRAKFRHSCTCSNPDSQILHQLQLSSDSLQQEMGNTIRARHGRALIGARPSLFDAWVDDLGRVEPQVLEFLVTHSQVPIFWSHSDAGLYARIVVTRAEDAIALLDGAAQSLGMSCIFLEDIRNLPSW
jgi:hypothetical protein